MPQLMPLNWVSSSFMLLLVVVCGCLIYGCKDNSVGTSLLSQGEFNEMTVLWFW